MGSKTKKGFFGNPYDHEGELGMWKNAGEPCKPLVNQWLWPAPMGIAVWYLTDIVAMMIINNIMYLFK